MGDSLGGDSAGREGSVLAQRRMGNGGPRNPDGTWLADVERGPYKPFPFQVGAQFGELTCVAWERKTTIAEYKNKHAYQPRMRCSCGWEGLVERANLRAGRTTRCNTCAKQKAARTLRQRQGYEEHCADAVHRERLITRISSIVSRCHNESNSVYADYGGRGIRVHAEWLAGRTGFLAYLVTLDGWDKPELQLDRIDNNRGYEPGNLRFCTRSENASNKRKIKARDVEELKRRIVALEQENANLRHSAGGAAQPVPSPD